MRYLVLLVAAISVATALVLLTEALRQAGDGFFSTLGFAANMLAGSAYLVWMSFQLGAHVAIAQSGQVSSAVEAMNAVNDILLFVACALTYSATAGFAASLGRVRWRRRGATIAYVATSFVALLFLVLRGLSFPNPTSSAVPWYTQPGFIVGIPAIPWIMPFLLGIVLIRRAGDQPTSTLPT